MRQIQFQNLQSQDARTSFGPLRWCAGLMLCWALPFGLAWGVGVQRLSTDMQGLEGNADSFSPAITPNGRYVVFESDASNLVAGDNNNARDIFRMHLKTGKLQRVSTNAQDLEANGSSNEPIITSNGRYVVFTSLASNLVGNDTNDSYDIFRKDIKTGKLLRVSTNTNGLESNSHSTSPTISRNGRYVVFYSLADNLVADDTNGMPDIFRKDLKTGEVLRVSTDAQGLEGNGDSYQPTITPNGRYVVFYSYASNLVADNNKTSDIFRKDLKTGKIWRVSTDTQGFEGNDDSYEPSITPNGRYVVFRSLASNLVADDANDARDIFRKDIKTGKVQRVSTDANGLEGNGDSYSPTITPNGRYVVFRSLASNLVAGDNNGMSDIFRKDLKSGKVWRVSTDAQGLEGNADSYRPVITRNGRVVAFYSAASNLVSGDNNRAYDIFRFNFKGKP